MSGLPQLSPAAQVSGLGHSPNDLSQMLGVVTCLMAPGIPYIVQHLSIYSFGSCLRPNPCVIVEGTCSVPWFSPFPVAFVVK